MGTLMIWILAAGSLAGVLAHVSVSAATPYYSDHGKRMIWSGISLIWGLATVILPLIFGADTSIALTAFAAIAAALNIMSFFVFSLEAGSAQG